MKYEKHFKAIVLGQERVLGICHFSGARNRDEKEWGEVVAIYLLPEIWGCGQGSELLRYSLGKLKKKGLKNICLWVRLKIFIMVKIHRIVGGNVNCYIVQDIIETAKGSVCPWLLISII